MPRIAQELATQIDKLDCESFQLGVVLDVPVEDLAASAWSHLGLSLEGDDLLVADPSVLPPPERGRYSRWNVEGREIIRRDLPKVTRSWVAYVYPYGRTDRSQVPAYRSRQVFPRERVHGKGFRIGVTVSREEGAAQARIGFRVDQVFDRSTRPEDPDLALASGLLRENVPGKVVALCGSMSADEWLSYRAVGWEFLPVGLRGPQLLTALMDRLNAGTAFPLPAVAAERLRAVLALNPAQVVVGTGRLDRYVAYVFREDLAVLENLNYGNAIYVLYENWEQTSQRSRLDLLAGPATDFTRIVHRGDWVTLLGEVIRRSRWRR